MLISKNFFINNWFSEMAGLTREVTMQLELKV